MNIKKSNNNQKLSQSLGSLTDTESGIIFGTLLGDATLVKRNESYRLKIDHGIDQLEFVNWKHSKLKRLCTTTQPPRKITDRRGFENVEFYTSSGLYLKPYFHLFYKLNEKGKYKKTITPELVYSLPMNPYVLAMFFLDDGSVRNDCAAGKIATMGFSKEEQELLIPYFEEWGIKINVVRHTVKSNQYYINLPASTFGTLVELIEPIVMEIPSMEYKLNKARKPRND